MKLISRTRITLAVVGVLALVGVGALVGPVGATPSTGETFVLLEDTWSASGKFSDSGSWTVDRRVFGGNPKVFVIGQLETAHTGANGTFRIRWEGLEIKGIFSGTWQIMPGQGTRDYAKLRGQGTWVYDPAAGVFTCPGQVHFD